MIKRLTMSIAALLIILSIAVTPVAADEPEFSVAAKLGTLGLGVDLDLGINKFFHARLGLGALKWGFDTSIDNLKYDFDMSLYTLGLFLDYHPGGSGFRLTGGVIINTHDISADTTPNPTDTYTIGDVSYTGAALGDLKAEAQYNQFAPYVGVGYGADFGNTGNWSFHMDLGVMWWGSPNVDLTASNENLVPGLAAELDKEAQKVEDDLKFMQWYPVLAVGVSYRF